MIEECLSEGTARGVSVVKEKARGLRLECPGNSDTDSRERGVEMKQADL